MREIKFRAWINNFKKFEAIEFIGAGQKTFPIYTKDNKYWFPMQGVLEQYTDLNDKNGVGIYENDVVETTYYNDVDDDLGKIGTIVFERGGFYIIFVGDNSKNNLGFIEPDETIVIGNIHENADLLEEQ